MSTKNNEKEETYTIVEYIREDKVVTKTQYINHLRGNLERKYDQINDLLIKKKKLLNEQEKLLSEKQKLMDEILKLSDIEDLTKMLEYAEFRYKELYPKKYKYLTNK